MIEIFVLLLLTLLNGFFALSEIALATAPAIKISSTESEKIAFNGYCFEIIDKDSHRIDKILMRAINPENQ
ncbi:MAG: hypothetical protein LBT29_01200 [Flavobacteriaceae bacterium]|jgi:CBS domain containing-hemolysin-like protein|nr:hypothetical protein [Flavobacteriaceae bacterium]